MFKHLMDLVFSGLIFLASLVLYIIACNSVGKSEIIDGFFFPKVLLILVMIFSILRLVTLIIGFKKVAKDQRSLKEEKLVFLCILAGILYLAGMQVLGFFIATVIFLFFFMYMLGQRKWMHLIITNLGVMVVIFIIFIKVLYVPLPTGISIFKVINEFIMYF